MSDVKDAAKQNKREARQLWDRSRELFGAGDYQMTRQLDGKIAEIAGDADPGPKAAKERSDLSVDRTVVYYGLAATALYLIAWVYALMG